MNFWGAVHDQMEKKRAQNTEKLRLKYERMSYLKSVNSYKGVVSKRKKTKSKSKSKSWSK